MGIQIFKGIETAHYADRLSGLDGIARFSLLENAHIKGKSFHVAAHIIGPDFNHEKDWHYSQTHTHAFDEINIILSESGTLKYKLEVDGIVEEILSPALIFIPAGNAHRAEPVCGTGIFLCLYLDADTSPELSKK